MKQDNSLAGLIIGFGKIWLNKTRTRQIRLIIILLAFQLITIVLFFTQLPPEIPLFFSRPWGQFQLTSPFSLLLLPLFSFIILLINLFLASLLIEKNEFLTNILTLSSLIFAFFALVAILKSIHLSL
ncbi:hypothetical protein ISS42_02790 [Candidatus Shapirobacteria bacterium]|nr:hypothetical protein [Candidatus Shapirobacteria bacterium]